ncbi:hypothetical protein PHYBLDRAFT_158182, partial [Phycomyces blakesleeanus NRRL 1555(-)]
MAAVQTKPISNHRFSTFFWDEHDRGVDLITDRLRTARQTCQDIKNLYKARANIEEEYGQRLLKLSQFSINTDGQGSFADALSNIPSAIETTGRAHLDLAQQIQHHLERPLDDFLSEQRELKKTQSNQI